MRDPEVIFNLWYIQDTEGVIYSLRARVYVGVGSDDDKVELLRRFAEIDYLIARPFPVPEAFHVVLADSGTKLPVAYAHAVSLMNAPLEIFEAAIKSLNDDIPAQTKLEIPRAPLVCITILTGDDGGELRPVITETKRL